MKGKRISTFTEKLLRGQLPAQQQTERYNLYTLGDTSINPVTMQTLSLKGKIMDRIYTFDFSIFIDGFLVQRGRASMEAKNIETAQDKLTAEIIDKLQLDSKPGEKTLEIDLHNVTIRIPSNVVPGKTIITT